MFQGGVYACAECFHQDVGQQERCCSWNYCDFQAKSKHGDHHGMFGFQSTLIPKPENYITFVSFDLVFDTDLQILQKNFGHADYQKQFWLHRYL